MKPKVTVLMAVYNGQRFLRAAIESVLDQTLADLELLVVDDCSTDNTPHILDGLRTPRLRVIRNEVNLGPGGARNEGLRNAAGEYIAVLDADDVACPERIASQVAYLDVHSEVALLGTACEIIDENGACVRVFYPPTDPTVLRWDLHFRNRIVHSTVMYRRDLALKVGGYDAHLPQAEDFALWAGLSAHHVLAQMPVVLARYRLNTSGLMHMQPSDLRSGTCEVVARNICRLTGLQVNPEVAACLNGQKVCPGIVVQAYRMLEACISAFLSTYPVSSQESSALFHALLSQLLELARQEEAHRAYALKIALGYGLRHSPGNLLTVRFAEFAVRVALPPAIRRLLRRPTLRPTQVEDGCA
jgi:hypothetical protein